MQGVEALSRLGPNLRHQDHSVFITIEDSKRQQIMDEALEVLQSQQVKITGIGFYQDNLEEIYRHVVAGIGGAA